MDSKFFKRLFIIVGIPLVILAILSFYVRFQTLKNDLRPDVGDTLELGRE